jgi:hypothetical protein
MDREVLGGEFFDLDGMDLPLVLNFVVHCLTD